MRRPGGRHSYYPLPGRKGRRLRLPEVGLGAISRSTGQASAPGRGRLSVRQIATPLGPMIGIADSVGVRLLQFADAPKLGSQREHCLRSLGRSIESLPNPHLREVEAQLAEYFAGRRSRFSVAIAPVGTPWQSAVWHRLLSLRWGETLFYEELARDLGRPTAVRAVASAVAANPILIVVPCHRIVPKVGGTGGYAAAPWRKERLLSLERAWRRKDPAPEE